MARKWFNLTTDTSGRLSYAVFYFRVQKKCGNCVAWCMFCVAKQMLLCALMCLTSVASDVRE